MRRDLGFGVAIRRSRDGTSLEKGTLLRVILITEAGQAIGRMPSCTRKHRIRVL